MARKNVLKQNNSVFHCNEKATNSDYARHLVSTQKQLNRVMNCLSKAKEKNYNLYLAIIATIQDTNLYNAIIYENRSIRYIDNHSYRNILNTFRAYGLILDSEEDDDSVHVDLLPHNFVMQPMNRLMLFSVVKDKDYESNTQERHLLEHDEVHSESVTEDSSGVLCYNNNDADCFYIDSDMYTVCLDDDKQEERVIFSLKSDHSNKSEPDCSFVAEQQYNIELATIDVISFAQQNTTELPVPTMYTEEETTTIYLGWQEDEEQDIYDDLELIAEQDTDDERDVDISQGNIKLIVFPKYYVDSIANSDVIKEECFHDHNKVRSQSNDHCNYMCNDCKSTAVTVT